MADELKRCPFCGSEASLTTKKSRYAVRCDFCGTRFGIRENTVSDAIKDWNTRQEECDRMREALEDLNGSVALFRGRGRDVSCQKRSMGDNCKCLPCCQARAKKALNNDGGEL